MREAGGLVPRECECEGEEKIETLCFGGGGGGGGGGGLWNGMRTGE